MIEEKTLEKLIKLVAESDSLTQIGEKYINYLYFETFMIALFFALIGYIIYRGIR